MPSISGKRFLLTLGGAIAAGLAVLIWRSRCGIEASFENAGSSMLRDVEIVTSAGTYPLGDLAPGDRRAAIVGAVGESSVAARWVGPDGMRRERDADCYFEGSENYGGTVEFVADDRDVRVAERIDLTFNPIPRGRASPVRR